MSKINRERKNNIRSFHKRMGDHKESFGIDYGRFHTYDDISDGVAWVDFSLISKYKRKEHVVFGTLSTAYHEIFDAKFEELQESDPAFKEEVSKLGRKDFLQWLNRRTEEEVSASRERTRKHMDQALEYAKNCPMEEILDHCWIHLKKNNPLFFSGVIPSLSIDKELINSFIDLYSRNLDIINRGRKVPFTRLKGYEGLKPNKEVDRTGCFSNALIV